MTKRAVRSVGTVIRIGTNAIGDLSSIGSPSITQEEIDVTTLDSEGGFREFIAGFKDPGELNISGFFVPSDVGQVAVYEALESGEVQDFEIIYPPQLGASWSFQGFVSSFTITAETEEAIGFEATIRVSGKSTLNFSSSAGISGLSLTGAGGILSPAFDAGTNYYTFAGVTDESVTVTVTAPNQTIKLYVDGKFQENLTGGQASSAIPFDTASSRKLTIIANESGKAPVVYEVVVVKSV